MVYFYIRNILIKLRSEREVERKKSHELQYYKNFIIFL